LDSKTAGCHYGMEFSHGLLNYATGGTHFWANPGTAKLLILPCLAASKMAHSGYMPGYLSHKTIVFDSSSAGSIPPLER
jgi:hypothetical protein